MTYSEVIKLPTYMDRLKALLIKSHVAERNYEQERIFAQDFYHNSREWQEVRNFVVVRDNGCDLACPDRPIFGPITVHHIRPITIADLSEHSGYLFDPENLITVSLNTHNAIHYSSMAMVMLRNADIIERMPNDTIPWR